MEQNLFGQILLNLNLITEDQLEGVLAAQRADRRPLGELLIEHAHIDEKTVNTILSIQTRRKKTGPESANVDEDRHRARMREAGILDFLKLAKESHASDLYLGSHDVPAIRLHGNLVELAVDPLPSEKAEELLFALIDDEQIEAYRRNRTLSVRLNLPEVGRFALSLYQHIRGDCGIFRFIPEEVWAFEKLGLPLTVRNLARKSNGLILITGPSRSGKSTTLAALVDYINRHEQRHILTIEDPLEAIHESHLSLVTHREVGTHTQSYASGLRAALRQDPDVLVIGEMRDAETIATAITAAETGHLVLGTLHTKNTYRTIHRIIDEFPHKRAHIRTILSGVLRGIVSQDLVPNLDGGGSSLAYEVLIVNAAVSHVIREDRIWQIPMTMQLGASEGMVLMDDVLLNLYKKGKVSLEEAVIRASEREKFINLQEMPGQPTAVTTGSGGGAAHRPTR